MRANRMRWLASVLAILVMGAATASGQSEWLELKRAQAQLDLKTRELERIESLFHEGLVSEVELGRARTAAEIARLDFQEAVFHVQGKRIRVQIVDAVRAASPDGLDEIRLTLQVPGEFSRPGTAAQRPADSDLAEVLGAADVLVSLRQDGVIVSRPWETVIPFLAPGKPEAVVFKLLRPVDAPTVHIEYAGQVDERRLFFRGADDAQALRVSAEQPALDGVLGESVRYKLEADLLAAGERAYSLGVADLPAGCQASFAESEDGPRLSELRLQPGQGARPLLLLVRLPDAELPGIRVDQAIAFAAVLEPVTRNAGSAIRMPLRLTPRGAAALKVEARSWLVAGKAGSNLEFDAHIVNEGSGPARGVVLRADPPRGLTVTVTPKDIAALDPGEKALVRVTIATDADSAAGDYTVRLRPTSRATSTAARAFEAELRVRIEERRAIVPVITVSLILLLLGVGTLVAIRRFSRD